MIRALAAFLLCLTLGTASAQLGGGMMFPGPGGHGAVTPLSYTFNAFRQNAAIGGVAYTETAVAVGVADPTRIIKVVFNGTAAAAATITAASSSICGVTPTKDVEASGAARGITTILSAPVPLGTTCTMTVVASASLARGSIGSYSLYNAVSGTPVTTNTATTSTSGQALSMNANVATGNVVIAGAYDNGDNSAPPALSWAGVTQDYNANAAGDGESGASLLALATSTPLTISATYVTSSRGTGAVAVYH